MISEDKKVVILVAVYNGGKYLEELVESLISQTYKNIKIVLSDDGSTDNSTELIETLAKKDARIERYRSGEKFGSAAMHFMHLIKAFQDEEYVCLCDQDDVWKPDKVEKTLKAMCDGEKGARLVHTDAHVTDVGLNIINESFHSFFSMKNELSFSERLVENNVQGSSAMLNRELMRIVSGYDRRVIMHDWFIALCASAAGDIKYLPERTFFYRQHGENVVGASEKPQSISYILKRIKTDVSGDIIKGRHQAALVLELAGEKMSENDRAAAEAYSLGVNKNKLKRLRDMEKFGIKPDSFLKKIKFLIWG